jgi:pyridoxamine 5'-phosphate oxidase
VQLDPDPFRQFQQWLQEALAAGGADPHAMSLATATPDGVPSARMVILRGLDERGFVFYTDFDGQKARELEVNPHAALVSYWAPLERQVRVTGRARRTTREETEAHFRTRPRGAQLAAWIRQSRVLASRTALEEEFGQMEGRYAAGDVPLPPFWGGYRLHPDMFEFWQGRPDRLHDRVRYARRSDGEWIQERLTP